MYYNGQVPSGRLSPPQSLSFMNHPASDGLGLSAIQSAFVAGGPMHPAVSQAHLHPVHMPQQQSQMVQAQPGSNGQNDLRRLAPRQIPQQAVPPPQMVIYNQSRMNVPLHYPYTIQQNRTVNMPYIVNHNGQRMQLAPMAFAAQPQIVSLQGGLRQVLTAQQAQQMNNHHHIQLQQQQHFTQQQQHHQQQRNGNSHPHPHPQQSQARLTSPQQQNGNAEVVTINDSSPEGSQDDNASVEDASDMPVLDRQDGAHSASSEHTSDTSDTQTDAHQRVFMRETEEYDERSKGEAVPHTLADNICILESKEPFATTAPQSSADEEDPVEIQPEAPREQQRVPSPQRTTAVAVAAVPARRGRGRPRGAGRGGKKANLSRESERHLHELRTPVKQAKKRTLSPEGSSAEKKKRKPKRKEADILMAMDFGPKAGERIMPEVRRNRGSGQHQLEYSVSPPPPRRSRNGRRSFESGSFAGDAQQSYVTEEEEEPPVGDKEEEGTEGSEFEIKQSKVKAEEQRCPGCNKVLVEKAGNRRPQWCSSRCRRIYSTSSELKRKKKRKEKTSDESEEKSLESSDGYVPAQKRQPPEQSEAPEKRQRKIEVVGVEEMSVPTEDPKQSRKTTGKEGEGAENKPDAPARRRLRLSSSSYTSEPLPGCSGTSKIAKKPSITSQSSPKPERSITPQAASSSKTGSLEVVPKLEESPSTTPVAKDDAKKDKDEITPGTISRTPSSRLEVSNYPPGNPETWDSETTAEYASKEFGAEIGQLCQKYELDGYVLFHGGETLERIRKAHFKLEGGKGIPFGPWKKMTSTMQSLKELVSKEVVPASNLAAEHPLIPNCSCEQLDDWIEGVAGPSVSKIFDSLEISFFTLLTTPIDELVHVTGINYGPLLRLLLIFSKVMKINNCPNLEARVIQDFKPRFPSPAEFESWLKIFLEPDCVSTLIQNNVDMDLLYFTTAEGYMKGLGMPFGPAKAIVNATRIVQEKANGRPSKNLQETNGKTLESIFDSDSFKQLLQETITDPKVLERLQTAGLDAYSAYYTTLEEFVNELKIPFGYAQRLIVKLEAFKARGGYDPQESHPIYKVLSSFVDDYHRLTVDDVAEWVKKICGAEAGEIVRRAGIDGKSFPFLTMENLQKNLKLSFVNAKKIMITLNKLSGVNIALPPNFEKYEGDKLLSWIEKTINKETRNHLEGTDMKASYLAHIGINDLISLGLKFGCAVRLTGIAEKRMKESGVEAAPGTPVTEWTEDEVFAWVSAITKPEVAEKLKSNQIGGDTLQSMTFEELESEVEIPFGPATVIFNLLKKLH